MLDTSRTDTCRPANRQKLTAVYTQGKLLLAAAGMKPTACSRVKFEQSCLDADPPRFTLVCSGPDANGTVTTPYQIGDVFTVGAPRDAVIISHADGKDRVPVLAVQDPLALERRQPSKLVCLSGAASMDGDVDGVPAFFEEMLRADGEAVPPPLIWPLRLGALFDGRVELCDAVPRRATGYSDTFDFREAFLDALRNLPEDSNEVPDKLTAVQVTSTGALMGGLDGFGRLFVSILAY